MRVGSTRYQIAEAVLEYGGYRVNNIPSQKTVQERLPHIPKTTVSVELGRMVRAGLLNPIPKIGERGGRGFMITNDGLDKLMELRREHRELFEQHCVSIIGPEGTVVEVVGPFRDLPTAKLWADQRGVVDYEAWVMKLRDPHRWFTNPHRVPELPDR